MKTAKTILLQKAINKQNYELRISKLPQPRKETIIIAKELIWTKEQIEAFENYMMQDNLEIESLDLKYIDGKQEVAWIHEKGKTNGWYVDNQGYSYARYVGKA